MKKLNVDPSHSSIGFTVKHMMISKVRGSFESYEAEVETPEDSLKDGKIDFKIDVASISTGSEDRDNHLRSADFFDAENHPHITFRSTEIRDNGGDEYELTGDLTIKGVTRPVTFKTEYEGKGTNPWGQEVVGYSADGKINRKDFGLTWNQPLETGGVLVGEDIKISVEIQASAAQ
ncbi:YceI family protein [Indiicoccus explosivorum]|uniref:YceI family protein n=1 Tax=Indiicoccus explosivorum TaxID=1917864 RepID=UPI000B440E91|nr:YceI family protein [Indiicoccus explosivorum]